MSNDNNNNEAQEQKYRDRIALIVSLIFVGAIALLGYRFLNNSSNVQTAFYNLSESQRTESDESNILATNTERDIEIEADSEGLKLDSTNSFFIDSAEAQEDATIQQNDSSTSDSSVFSQWVANDYNGGEISAGGEYQVKQGDTLWEIAEAAYGNGADWVQILNANQDSVGFMPNGQQSLIYSGQTLVIPSIN